MEMGGGSYLKAHESMQPLLELELELELELGRKEEGGGGPQSII